MRRLVDGRRTQLGWSWATMARETRLSPTTLRNLGSYGKRDSNRTLLKLASSVGLTMEELQRARNADDQARAALSEWPPRVYQLAVRASLLSEREQELLLRLADAIAATYRDAD